MSDCTESSGPPSPGPPSPDPCRSESGVGEEIEMDIFGGDLQDIINKLDDVTNLGEDNETSIADDDTSGVSVGSFDSSSIGRDFTDNDYEVFHIDEQEAKERKKGKGIPGKDLSKGSFKNKHRPDRQFSQTKLLPETVPDPKDEEKSTRRNPFSKLLRRLSSKETFEVTPELDQIVELEPTHPTRNINQVRPGKHEQWVRLRVECLPQIFITKYLGCRPCTGLWGVSHIRGPVEELVGSARSIDSGPDLPLAELLISAEGIEVSEHKQNKGRQINKESIPIEFISYGVQDVKYTRVFTFIIVQQMSWKAKKLECHAYLCDCAETARRLALAVALAFKEYAQTMEGQAFKFGVDLAKAKPKALAPDISRPSTSAAASEYDA